MGNPRLNPVVLLSPVEGGYVAYNPVLDRLHHLNPIAALLAELCDGSRSSNDIGALTKPLVPDERYDEIRRWIEDGLKVGLLVEEGSEASGQQELTAEQLSTLSKRLKEKGNIQTAFLCGKRAVELNPNDSQAWYDLGDIAQYVGRREEARDAYQKYFEAHPEDAEIEHLLMALRDDAPPPRASDRTIQHIYKSFAATYESRMLEDLKYVGPARIEESVQFAFGDKRDLSVLDLGCGSGLAGMAIKPRAAALTGIDLSPEMIALAKAHNIYDRLEVSELTAWLDEGNLLFDLIISCDCLIYFGDLNRVVCAVKRRLKPGGFFVMSLERGNRYPFHLTDTGRYEHHPDHVRSLAAQSGLKLLRLSENFLRFEYGVEVVGIFAVFGND